MCWLCDNPDATKADYLRMVRDRIAAHGWIVQGIEQARSYPPFSYTVGLTGGGLAELVVTGLHHVTAQDLLNAVAAHSRNNGPLAHGDRLTVAGISLEVVALSDPTAHLTIAVNLYGSSITALQLVYADDHGAWPWSLDYSAPHRQPVLGPRAVDTDTDTDTATVPHDDNP